MGSLTVEVIEAAVVEVKRQRAAICCMYCGEPGVASTDGSHLMFVDGGVHWLHGTCLQKLKELPDEAWERVDARNTQASDVAEE